MVAGVDEAGRGPLAGPVVAGAVVLSGAEPPFPFRDSKTISEGRREALFEWLRVSGASVGVGIVEPDEIDRINILRASLLAMRRAVEMLNPAPHRLMVDGTFIIPGCALPQEAIVKGDAKIPAISAASIVAKVTRDRIMGKYHGEFPQYGFDRHKGYPTKEHKEAILRFGPSVIHRRTFSGVKGIGLFPEP